MSDYRSPLQDFGEHHLHDTVHHVNAANNNTHTTNNLTPHATLNSPSSLHSSQHQSSDTTSVSQSSSHLLNQRLQSILPARPTSGTTSYILPSHVFTSNNAQLTSQDFTTSLSSFDFLDDQIQAIINRSYVETRQFQTTPTGLSSTPPLPDSTTSAAHTANRSCVAHNTDSTNSYCSHKSYLTTSSVSFPAHTHVLPEPTRMYSTHSSGYPLAPPVHDIWFTNNTSFSLDDDDTIVFFPESHSDKEDSTDSSSMHSTERLWAEVYAEMGYDISPDAPSGDPPSIRPTIGATSLSSEIGECNAASSSSTVSYYDLSLSSSERRAINRLEDQRRIRSTSNLWDTIVQDMDAQETFRRLQAAHNDQASSTTSICPPSVSDSVMNPMLQALPGSAYLLPSIPGIIWITHTPPTPARTYRSYPEDDIWSLSSISSDSTCTTTASTQLPLENGDKDQDTPFHNPMFLGSLNYYFPPRLRPMAEEYQCDSIAINTLAATTPDVHTCQLRSLIPSSVLRNCTTPMRSTAITGNAAPIPTNASNTLPSPISMKDSNAIIDFEGVITPTSDIHRHQFNASLNRDSSTHRYRGIQTTLEQNWSNFHDSTSIRPNETWGDTVEVKCNNTVRIFFQNVNSLGLSQGTDKVNTVLQSVKQMDCDIVSFVQTSINWRFLHLRNRLRIALKRVFPKSKLNIARNKFPSEQPALPGGCAQIVIGDWSGRVVEFIHDFRNMGRWCGIKLRLKGDRHLYLITAYRVCKQSSAHIGPETAYRQQELMLALDGIENPDPRKQFIQDLTKCIKQWQSPLDDVLVSMDVNEQIGDSAQGLTSMMRECRLIDIFHHHHGTYPSFETFDLGSKRIDYIIGSASLLPFTKRCGYLAFYQGIPSDHRGLFIDLSLELIDGLTRLENTPTRHLHSSFQQDVHRYKHFVQTEFLSHNIFQKANALFEQSLVSSTPELPFQQQLEQLDSLILNIQLKAELKCCSRRTKFDSSDDIHFTKKCLLYWYTKRKRYTRGRDSNIICSHIYNQLPIEHRKLIDVATGSAKKNWLGTKQRLQALMAQYRKVSAEAKHELWDNEATFLGTTVDKVKAKHDRIRKDKKLYNTLRHHFHPSDRNGITHLMVPDKDNQNQPTDDVDKATSWRMETQPQQVLDLLFSRNVSHFGQAEGTPFTTSPLLEQFGYTGMTSPGVNLIQKGIIPDTLDPDQTQVNNIFSRLGEDATNHYVLSDLLTLEKFTKAIKKWSESTSTSPSGKHLGHYKSLIAIDNKSSTYTEEQPDPGPAILKVLYEIAASAFNTGLTIPRWTKVTSCMIEKLPGNPRINKLRVIHLYEADYNAFNKLIWQRGIVWDAHTKGKLNKGQSGSRPNRTSIETVMSKGQKYLYSQLTRIPMATMDNDAKSCYDRIVATVALLVSHKFGVPEEFCTTVGNTLRTMQFSIRTAMGDSPQTYCHSDATPIHGVGQGGTASPAFWLLVSSILFDCYQRSATGMTLTDPTNTITVRQWLEALVDDTSLFTNLQTGSDIHMLVRTLEQDAQIWEKFLSASGGCLELSKCFYYILAWTFDQNGDASPMSIDEINSLTSAIHLQEHNKDQRTPIASKSPEEAHKTLGVWKAMDGNVREQVKVLSQRSRNLANIVATSGLYPYQADVALRMIYTPAMTYSLPAVSIPESTLNKIQCKAIESFLPAMGYNPGFPHAVVFGPTEYGGVGVPHLYTEMQLSKLEYLIMHIRDNSELGQIFRINLNWIQMHLGLSTPLFEYQKPITYVKNWFTHVHDFLLQINGRLVIKHLYVPKLEREFDSCIMNAICSCSVQLSKNQLRHVNNWRLYFRVCKVSDISNASGDQILPIYLDFLTNTENISHRVSKLDWPRQDKPTCKRTFQLWVKCLRVCFLNNRSNRLTRPLGKWLVSSAESESTWNAYIDSSYMSLIYIIDGIIRRYDRVTRQTSCTSIFDSTTFEIILTIPMTFFPVQISQSDSSIIASHNKQHMILPSPVTIRNPQDLTVNIQLSPKWKTHLLQHFHIYNSEEFQKNLQQIDTKFLIVADGGLREGKGSFGVAMGTFQTDLGTIEGPAPGNSLLLTSLRSEAYGLLAGLTFLNMYVTTYQIDIPLNRIIQLYSDNLGLVCWIAEILSNSCYPRMYLRAEADILAQIQHELISANQLNFQFTIEHVKGHQDDIISYNELSRPAQLNVKADEYATNYLHQGQDVPYDEVCNNPVSLFVADSIITRDYKRQIRSASRSPSLRKYLIDKFRWKNNTPDLVWWQVHGKSLASFSNSQQRCLRKYIFVWWPTCSRLHSYHKTPNNAPEANCPSCPCEDETQTHILQCPSYHRSVIKQTWFKEISSFLRNDRYTPPYVGELFYNHLIYVLYSDNTAPVIPDCDSMIQQAALHQQQIGWQQLLHGRLAFTWGQAIGRHLATNHISDKEMTTQRWGTTVISMIFQLVLDLWTQRNLEGHQSNDKNESQLSRDRIINKIIALQESSPEVRYCDRDFVFTPIDTLAQFSLPNLISWHRAACSIIKAQEKYRIQHRSIREFFPGQHRNLSNSLSNAPIILPDHEPEFSLGFRAHNSSSTGTFTNSSPAAGGFQGSYE